jgi:type IV secretion system protein VirD4
MPGYILGRRGSASRDFGFVARARQDAGDLITYSGDGHLITFAPTGTGKTSGPVICNALRHPGQLIVVDMKGEVFKATAKARRAMGQEVHVLDLRDDGEAGSLNPLDLAIRSGTDIAAIARSFAAEMIERAYGEWDRFWNDWAQTMITGAVAWLLADRPPEERRLSALFDLYHHHDVVYHLAVMMDKKEVKNRAALAAFTAFLQLPSENTRPAVLGTTQTHVRLFDSQLVRRATDTTSFDLDAFISGAFMSLYIIVPPLRLTAYAPLLRMWLSGLILAMTQRNKLPKEHLYIALQCVRSRRALTSHCASHWPSLRTPALRHKVQHRPASLVLL